MFQVSHLGLISAVQECRELLISAISHDCDVSILRGLHRLWQKLVVLQALPSDINTIVAFYRDVLAASSGIPAADWSDTAVIDRCLELGLIENDLIG